jgi:hypothetical protein
MFFSSQSLTEIPSIASSTSPCLSVYACVHECVCVRACIRAFARVCLRVPETKLVGLRALGHISDHEFEAFLRLLVLSHGLDRAVVACGCYSNTYACACVTG